MRDSYVMYRSFIKAIRNLPASKFKKIILAISDYALDDIEGDFDDLMLEGMFELIKPQLDANKKRYDNGKKGGRPKANNNQTETETKPKQKANNNQSNNLTNNQTETESITETKPNVNVNDNVNVNVNDNNQTETETKPKAKTLFDKCKTNQEIKKLLHDISKDESFLKDLIAYRRKIKPLKSEIGVKGILKNLLDTSIATGKSVEELFALMQEREWLTIQPDYIKPKLQVSKPKTAVDKNRETFMKLMQEQAAGGMV